MQPQDEWLLTDGLGGFAMGTRDGVPRRRYHGLCMASMAPPLRRRTILRAAMAEVFDELYRVVRPGGYVAFEVGEVRRGKVRLEEHVVPVAAESGLEPELVMLHTQDFTKTAKCWGVENNKLGTNTNRVVVLRRP